MDALPANPDLDQLRHQARERQRAEGTTLALAQLAIAREYGFSSWARLKAEVGRRRAGSPGPDDPQPVKSLSELAVAFDWIGARSSPAFTHGDRRFRELASRFIDDRSLMLVLRDRGRTVGGLLACRRADGVSPRALAVEPGAAAEERLTRLLQGLEVAARRLGADRIYEGGVVEPTQLYERLGYRGRNPMVKHLLPLPGRARDRRLQAATLERRSP